MRQLPEFQRAHADVQPDAVIEPKEELILRVAENNRAIGPVSRKEAREKKYWHRCSAVFVHTPRGFII